MTSEVTAGRTLSAEEIRETVAARLELPAAEIGFEEDLVTLGLDSLGMMNLAAAWQELGVEVTFGDLVEEPTVRAWSALLSGTEGAGPRPEAGIAPAAEAGEFPLAPMQHAYWSGRQPGMPLGTGSHFYFEFDVTADVARWDAAVAALRRRHPMLRAAVGAGGQRIVPECRGLDEVVDLRGLEKPDRERRLAELRGNLSHQTLPVGDGGGLDVRLALLPAGKGRLFLDIDMIVCDASSFRIVVGDLARLHEDPDAALPQPVLTYPEYRRLVAESGRGPGDADVSYWRDRAEKLPEAPRLPLAAPPERIERVHTVRRHAWLAPETYERFALHARSNGLTVSMAVAAAYADVLAAWSEEAEFLLNLPVLNRVPVHPEVGRIVGDFTDLLLLRVAPDARRTFVERARAVQEQYRRDAMHTAYGGTSVLRDLARTAAGANRRAGVVFTSALSLGELFDEATRAVLGTPVWMSSQTSGVWIDLQLIEHDSGMLINWETAENLFEAGVPEAMFETFVNRVRLLASQPSAWWESLPVRPPAPQLQARRSANDTRADLPRRALHERFFRLAAERGRATAALWGDGEKLTYGELAERALRLAHALRTAGVTAGDRVVLTLPKGVEQVVAVLAVHALGAAYVPVGTDQPEARRRTVESLAGARCVVARGPDRDAADGRIPHVDVRCCTDRGLPSLEGPVDVPADAPAYVIFTSGSTGQPKGVELTHAAAHNTVAALNRRYRVGPADRTLCLSALDFDLSVYDMFGPLTSGGALVLVGDEERRSPETWLRRAAEHRATVLNCVPALLDMALTTAESRPAPGGWPFRLQLLGGDWAGLDLPGRVHALRRDSVFAVLGGTTETAIHSTVQEVTEVDPSWTSIPYNVPLPNQRCRIVDEHGGDRPDWVAGELWIGGAGVARGYVGAPELTAEKFVEVDGGRWYRTGDRARYRPGAVIEFLGRADLQVKLNGYRVELGEVERALGLHPGVRDAVVAPVPGHGGALYALVAPGSVDPEEVLATAARQVPAYMVPARAVAVDELPLSRNGKIDRAEAGRLLAGALDERASGGASTAPRGAAEETVAALWAELLGGGPIGRDTNFFHIGGDSLQATRLLAALRREGYDARLGDLFTRPTVTGFAGTLTRVGPRAPDTVPADPAHRYDPFPLTDVQRAYWLGRDPDFALGGVASYWYWEFESDRVDLDRLEAAWNRLVRRHEMMRAVLDGEGGQRILPDVPYYRFAVTRTTAADHEKAVAALGDMAQQVLDVTSWPLFDVRAVQREDGRTVFGVGFDYVVLDALSIMTIFTELNALYADPGLELPAIDLSFRDYLLARRTDPVARARDEEYWLRTIEDLPAAPALPMALDPERVDRPRFVRDEFRLDRETWTKLRRRTADEGLTTSTVVAAAFAEVLAAWSAETSLTLNLTVFDRQDVHPQVGQVVGDFTSLLLLGHHSRPEGSWADTVRRLQGQVWEGIEHRGVSTTWVLQQLARRTGGGQTLMPVVFTSTLGVSADFKDLEFGFGELRRGLSQSPQVALDCQVVERGGGLAVNWDHVDGLFSPGVVTAALEAMRRLLVALADSDWSCPAPPIALPDAQAKVRAEVNDTAAARPARTLHQPVLDVARRTPDAVAVRSASGLALTYAELAGRALGVAGYLVSCGARPGETVVVSLPKGPDQVVAVLGVLAAGCAYVPVGVGQPAARRNRIVRSAGARLALVSDGPEPGGDWDQAVRRVSVAEASAAEPVAEPVPVDPAQLAYVIYTSGSTGEPKGVEITHAAAANTIDDVNARYGVGPDDVVLQVSALDFDLSVYDLFGLLAVGGTVVTLTEDVRREAAVWASLAAEHGVTVWNTVPTLLDMLLVACESGTSLPRLRVAIVSGDWVGLDLPDRLRAAAPDALLVAMGGATEASIWSNAHEVPAVDPAWVSIPYGRPLANQRFRVVDAHGRDRPDFVPGELWIGGAGVALGYRGDPDRTAASFVTAGGERWYRTGDLGRYHPSGVLEFLGRRDHQVKVRGHRIELGEIETRLRELPGVAGAVAWVDSSAGVRRLAAVVTPERGAGPAPTGAELLDALAGQLPAHMLPEHLTVVDRLPLNANGKVDRAAVAQAYGLRDAAESAPADDRPRGDTERAVAEVWSALLEAPGVGRGANFFALGGDSLTATRVVRQFSRRFGVELSLRQLFNHPTIAGIAAVIDAEISGSHQHEASVRLEEGVL
ncbi:amino acid adenylation domain-containing protein [Streptomyces sp. OF3]|uniref:Phenyloxazoline synthase MbtB n=1 Tax=Streptomyces alkaliterrae TaxID=2213162 RepID=A0A7W3ZLT9_9ACTN|nr:non-ribosomal peptide synthetase [Streptomyces alkaliterrae]MBB1252642.1 amino acid adenylation domain-containing protein [Streptomyces alkaliterrae]